jgi:hypothetical protein
VSPLSGGIHHIIRREIVNTEYREHQFVRDGDHVAMAWEVYDTAFRRGHRSRLLPEIHPVGEGELTVAIVDNGSEELLQAYRDRGFEEAIIWSST